MRALAAVTLVLAIACTDAADAATKKRARLKAFASCTQLVDYARAGAERTKGGVGVTGRAAPMPVDAVLTPPLPPQMPTTTDGSIAPMPVAPVSAERMDGGTAVGGTVDVPDFSGTNVQEAGVDEPDILKTDGRRVFAVTDRKLRVIDVASGTITGTLALDGHGHRLLLRGDRLLAISSKGTGTSPMPRPVEPEFAPVSDATIVTELDVSGAPKVMRTMEVPGRFVDARQNGAVARLVIDSVPQPIEDAGDAGVRDFLGRTVLKSNLSGKTFKRNLAPCDAVTRPAQFSGLNVLAILTVDLDRGMYSLDRDGVMAGAQVVYGSQGSLYVASHRYVRSVETGGTVPDGMQTEIHRFDISDPTKTVYRASGSVPGFILNNYALSEHDGKLRVASTEQPSWAPGMMPESQSTVTVLEQQGNRLARIGSVSGLGKGERIYAVRFMGEQGYVVTFRQVDPLYTLDLRDPKAPKVVGELKIPGYSAYLHPVGEGRLLGIGREGAGVQASLFDVSNPAAPARLAVLPLGPGQTPVESESHAFLYWAKANLAMIPLTTYSSSGPWTGSAGITIGASTLNERGRIVHETAERGKVPIERSFVIGDKLYTLSYLGVLSSNLADLTGVKYTAF